MKKGGKSNVCWIGWRGHGWSFWYKRKKQQLKCIVEVNEFENEKEIWKCLQKSRLFLPSDDSKK